MKAATRVVVTAFIETIVVIILTVIVSRVSKAECTVTIATPAPNTEVGSTVDVSGSVSDIPAGDKMWVFAHMSGLGVWWPQGGGAAAGYGDKEWKIAAYIGEPRDIGRNFEITTRVVEPMDNGKLEQWVRETSQSGRYPGIAMPNSVATCSPNPTVVVKKTG